MPDPRWSFDGTQEEWNERNEWSKRCYDEFWESHRWLLPILYIGAILVAAALIMFVLLTWKYTGV